jgi:PTH2 family peptidyl-tRNA hydrolase
MERIKQVILIRKDLKMRRGKEIAQGSHASMQFMVDPIINQISKHTKDISDSGNLSTTLNLSETEKNWLVKGMAKVCLRVDSEEHLLSLHKKATQAGLKSFLITDSGRTEFKGKPTITACAIGPDFISAIDNITGDLTPY